MRLLIFACETDQPLADFVAVGHLVHQPGIQGHLRSPAPIFSDEVLETVDVVLQPLDLELAALGGLPEPDFPHIFEVCEVGLFGLLGHAVPHERLDRRFVLADPENVNFKPKPIETVLVIGHVAAETCEQDHAHWMKVDFVRLRGQEVGLLAEIIPGGDDLLAAFPEIREGRFQVEQFAHARAAQLVEVQHERFDPPVVFGLMDRVQKVLEQHLGFPLAHETVQGIAAELFHQRPFGIQHQSRAVRNARAAPFKRRENQARNNHPEQQAEHKTLKKPQAPSRPLQGGLETAIPFCHGCSTFQEEVPGYAVPLNPKTMIV